MVAVAILVAVVVKSGGGGDEGRGGTLVYTTDKFVQYNEYCYLT